MIKLTAYLRKRIQYVQIPSCVLYFTGFIAKKKIKTLCAQMLNAATLALCTLNIFRLIIREKF